MENECHVGACVKNCRNFRSKFICNRLMLFFGYNSIQNIPYASMGLWSYVLDEPMLVFAADVGVNTNIGHSWNCVGV